jgi:hypothetical protein
MAVALIYFLGKYRIWKHDGKVFNDALLASNARGDPLGLK